MNESRKSRLDQMLDLLAEEVADRLSTDSAPHSLPSGTEPSTKEAARRRQARARPPEAPEPAQRPQPAPGTDVNAETEDGRSEGDAQIEEKLETPSAPPMPSHTARLLGRLALGLLALVIVINIPINRHGTTLATAMPDSRALVIRDGLVVKEEDDPEIYVYQDSRFRWISSLKAFEMRGYTWDDVRVVEDGFLAPYEIGPPIHVILKCPNSPHIYRMEGEEKRWIVDIETFEAEGYVWEDVETVSCSYLRSLPDGETIPPDQGPPPQP